MQTKGSENELENEMENQEEPSSQELKTSRDLFRIV